MVKIFISNIKGYKESEISYDYSLLPMVIQNEISKYKFAKDRHIRVVSRLMLKNQILEDGRDINLLESWQRDHLNKPFIIDYYPFNISHSGEMCVLAISDETIGVDIEEMKETNLDMLVSALHEEEQKFILKSASSLRSFYHIWVKKEAFLKAVGIGVTNGLNHFNCLEDMIIYKGKTWYFHQVNLLENYVLFFCSQKEDKEFELNICKGIRSAI